MTYRTLAGFAVWVLCAAVAAAAEPGAANDEARAIEAIKKLGGSVWGEDMVFFHFACSDAELRVAVPHLRKLPKLRRISLNFTRVSDEGLASLKELTQLQVLTAKVTDVTDSGLAHLAKMPQLTEVNLTLTRVTEKGVVEQKKSALPDAKVTDSGRGTPADEALALRGTWRGSRVWPRGEEHPEPKHSLIVSGNDLALGFEIGRFTIDPDRNPKSIDVEVTDCLPGLNSPWGRYLGIYQIDGDTLTLCFSPVYGDRKTRPTRFSPEGLYGWMYVFERVKE